MPSELVLAAIGAITEAVFAYLLEKSDPMGWLRQKLSLDAEKRAFERALAMAVKVTETKHPVTRLFDARDGAPILAQLLLRDGHPDPSELAAVWTDALNIADAAHHTARVREWEPIAADLLEALSVALKEESALRNLHNDRAQEQMARDIAALRTQLGADKATAGTRRDYLRWMMEQNEYLDPRGIAQTQRQVQPRLDEVYVSLRAQREATAQVPDKRYLAEEEAEIEIQLAAPSLSEEEREAQREVWLAARHLLHERHTPGETLNLSNVVAQHEKLVITGEPGSGKSTLLRHLAFQNAQALWTGAQEIGDELGEARFPILLRIAEYAQHALPKQLSLSDYLALHCAAHEGPTQGLADLLRRELGAGSCLILLDGLDEIVTIEDRIKVVGQIEDFVRRHDHRPNRFVITSRMAGYDSAPLAASFTRYTIQVMSEKQIERFLERWTLAVESAQTPDLPVEQRQATAQREAEGIMKSVRDNPGVRRLAANPLLLVILALIHRTGGRLPQKRIELYEIAAETLARDWRLAQGVPASALAKQEYVTPLLSKLAYWMHRYRPTGLATEDEVLQVLGPEWAALTGEEWSDNPRANTPLVIEIRKFLVTVRAHTGLFVERAPNLYGFMHLTFEEYYAARYLVADASTRAQLIRQHLHNPRWEEPILLALGHLGKHYPVDAKNLLELAVLNRGTTDAPPLFAPTPYEDILGRDYLFLLRCLGDQIPAKPKTVQGAMERLADELLHRSGSGRFTRYRHALEQRLAYLAGSEAATRLASILVEILNDRTPDSIQIEAMGYLGRLESNTPEIKVVLLQMVRSGHQNVWYHASHTLERWETENSEMTGALLDRLHDSEGGVRALVVQRLGWSGVKAATAEVFYREGWIGQPALTNSLNQRGNVAIEVITALSDSLQDQDRHVRRAAVSSLRFLGVATNEVVKVLLEDLQAQDQLTRHWAANYLGQLGVRTSPVVAALVAALYDSDNRVREQASSSLRKLGGNAPDVSMMLLEELDRAERDSGSRVWVALTLAELGVGTPEIVLGLLDGLRDEEEMVRYQAVRGLGQLRSALPEAMPALLTALHDTSPNVRWIAAHSLGELEENAHPEVVTGLLEALEDEAKEVRDQAAESLAHLGVATPEVVTVLIEELARSKGEEYDIIVDRLTQLRSTPGMVTSLLALLRDGSENTQALAAKGLGIIEKDSSEAIAALLEALRSLPDKVRANAAWSLGEVGQDKPEVFAALRAALVDSASDVRHQAAWSLSHLGQSLPEGVPIWVDVLNSAEGEGIREWAAKMLGAQAPPSHKVIDALYDGLHIPNHNVRVACATALARLGHRAPQLAPTLIQRLQEALDDPDFEQWDDHGERGYGTAFDALWQLVVGEG